MDEKTLKLLNCMEASLDQVLNEVEAGFPETLRKGGGFSNADSHSLKKKVESLEANLEDIIAKNHPHLEFPDLERICAIQRKIKKVKDDCLLDGILPELGSSESLGLQQS